MDFIREHFSFEEINELVDDIPATMKPTPATTTAEYNRDWLDQDNEIIYWSGGNTNTLFISVICNMKHAYAHHQLQYFEFCPIVCTTFCSFRWGTSLFFIKAFT